MKLRLVSIGLLASISLFMFGCSNNNEIIEKSNETEIEKASTNEDEQKDSKIEKEHIKPEGFVPNPNVRPGRILEDISYSRELNSKELSMDESVEYIKQNLSQDIVEIESSYEEEFGVSEVRYELEGKNYEVRYMHPHKEDGNMIDEYDLTKTLGIYVKELD